MKKIVILSLLLSLSLVVKAQKRSLTQNELNQYYNMCKLFANALPTNYKNFTVESKNCNNPADFSLEMDGKGGYNTATIDNQAAGFLPTYHVTFSNPYSDSIYKKIESGFDYKKYMSDVDSINSQEAKLIKTNTSRNLKIVLTYNTGYDKLPEVFHVSTKPEQLNVPHAAFASLYKVPFGKVILEEDGTAMHHSNEDEVYTDRAVITFGIIPDVKTINALEKQSYSTQYITISDDGKLVLFDKIKHITVFIYGDEKDIKEIIKSITWEKINNLIGK